MKKLPRLIGKRVTGAEHAPLIGGIALTFDDGTYLEIWPSSDGELLVEMDGQPVLLPPLLPQG